MENTQEEIITVDNIKKPKPPNKPKEAAQRQRSYSLTSTSVSSPGESTKSVSKRVLLSRCPCQKSNESSWKLKCTACSQVWHTNCANLKASRVIPESVILSLEKTWTCPWCFRSPLLRPPGHPSFTNENQLFGTATADAICEKVSENISNNLLPEFQLSMDNLIKSRLKEISGKVDDQFKMIRDNISELTVLKEQILTTDSGDLGHSSNESEYPNESQIPPKLDKNPTNHIEDYQENFLSIDEITELNAMLGTLTFSQINGRGVASYGEEYHYNGAPRAVASEMPNSLKAIIAKIHDDPQYKDEKINQVVINKYTGTTHLPEHSDNEATIRPNSHIITLTPGEVLPIVFKDKVSQNEHKLEPANGSLFAMSMASQHHWSHRIDQADLLNTTRYSITLRSVGKNYKNSTIIIGDSNTKHLKFSSGQHKERGTFGYNMPGERIETFHIKQIEERKCLGYRNIVIHCGINDIRDNSPGRTENDPEPTDVKSHFELLARKVSLIKQMCPLSSIVVNPLLPTKNQRLNQRVLEFNALLFEFLANDVRGEGVRSSNLSAFVDEQWGVLREEYGVWDTRSNSYNKRDILHLGRQGIRLLAKTIRENVFTKLVTSRSYSSTLTNHPRVQQAWTSR